MRAPGRRRLGLQEAAPEAYEPAFRSERAASAYAAATLAQDPAEAVYEALHALGAPADTAFIFAL